MPPPRTEERVSASRDRRFHYRPELDGIRGFATLMVMGTHTTAFVASEYQGASRFYSGFLGLDWFFVLSGFLITTLLLRERETRGTIALPRFYARRALRLFPALVFGVAIAAICLAILGNNLGGKPFGESLIYVFTLIPNWSEQQLGFFGHLWSLGLEEQFYLVWPIVLIACLKRGLRLERIAFGVLGAAAFVAVTRAAYLHGFSPGEVIDGVRRSDAVMIGCATALMLESDAADRFKRFVTDRRTIRVAVGVVAGYIAYVEVMGRLGFEDTSKNILVFETAAFAVLFANLVIGRLTRTSRFLTWRPFVVTGRWSYGIYLVHYPLFNLFGRSGTNDPVVFAVLAWTLSFVLAGVSYYAVERPALKFKNGLKPRAKSLDRERVGRGSDAGVQVQRRGREEELVDAV
jgi:peptidoglycan/LPS O-acetylase OafA/YrhL